MKSIDMRNASLWFLVIVLSAAWSLVLTPMSWADTRGHGHGKHPNAADFIWHVLKAKETLGLSDEQDARLRTIATTFKKEHVKKTAEIELAEIDLHQLLSRQDKQAGGEDLETAVRKMYALKADRRIASIRAFQEVRSVLTPEQQKKLKELYEQRRGTMDGKGTGGERQHGHYGEHESAGAR